MLKCLGAIPPGYTIRKIAVSTIQQKPGELTCGDLSLRHAIIVMNRKYTVNGQNFVSVSYGPLGESRDLETTIMLKHLFCITKFREYITPILEHFFHASERSSQQFTQGAVVKYKQGIYLFEGGIYWIILLLEP